MAKFGAFHTSRPCESVDGFSSGGNRLSSGSERSKPPEKSNRRAGKSGRPGSVTMQFRPEDNAPETPERTTVRRKRFQRGCVRKVKHGRRWVWIGKYRVMDHDVSPRDSQANFRLISQIPWRHDRRTMVAERCGWDRILLRVGTAGIPARKNPFGAPGKSGRAVFAF